VFLYGTWFENANVKLSGSITPFRLVCPDIDIERPDGDPDLDPTQPGGANADNEAVFDDQIPQGEAVGTCRITCEANPMNGLSAAARAEVGELLEWRIEEADNVMAEPSIGINAHLVYDAMPASNAGFDKKLLTLTVSDTEWNYYQTVELFFHYDGTSAGGGTTPNWFYYWSEIRSPIAAAGSPGVPLFEAHSTINDWREFIGTNQESRIRLTSPGRLSFYIGILAHEQNHENDFYDVIWSQGYNAQQDKDGDHLRDTWERTQPMDAATNYGPWTFDVPADPNANPPEEAIVGTSAADDINVWAESTQQVKSWSDDRADQAAVNAINANLDINAQDWSDVNVGIPPDGTLSEVFYDENRQTEAKTSNPLSCSNNKHYHP